MHRRIRNTMIYQATIKTIVIDYRISRILFCDLNWGQLVLDWDLSTAASIYFYTCQRFIKSWRHNWSTRLWIGRSLVTPKSDILLFRNADFDFEDKSRQKWKFVRLKWLYQLVVQTDFEFLRPLWQFMYGNGCVIYNFLEYYFDSKFSRRFQGHMTIGNKVLYHWLFAIQDGWWCSIQRPRWWPKASRMSALPKCAYWDRLNVNNSSTLDKSIWYAPWEVTQLLVLPCAIYYMSKKYLNRSKS